MFYVAEIEMTCSACPSQWEGKTDDGRAVYARYRHGFLTVQVGGTTLDDALDADCIVAVQVGDQWDGVMDAQALARHTKDVVAWPSGFAKDEN